MTAAEILKQIYSDSEKTLVFGHRGAKAYAPMNTIPAFELAAEQGAHGIELDVHFSSDGELVILHDYTVDGTTSGKGDVVAKSLDELKSLDAGSWFDSHGSPPLEHTLDHAPDPGLLGPDSVSWRVIGDASAFVGGVRALLVQTAHPEVVAGVEQHSRYRDDPLGRLTRTSFYVTATTYGAMPEVEGAVALVRGAHGPVTGRSERGRPYSAGHPALAAWVHNVLTESFLAAYQAYGPTELTVAEADRFVEEQTKIGALLDADPMPTTADDLRTWVRDHPALEPTFDLEHAIDFLRDPPLSIPTKIGYQPLFGAAVATMPERLLDITGLDVPWRADRIGRAAVRSLRWALGSSPSWHVSLVRAGAPIPEGVFRQPLSEEARALMASRRA